MLTLLKQTPPMKTFQRRMELSIVHNWRNLQITSFNLWWTKSERSLRTPPKRYGCSSLSLAQSNSLHQPFQIPHIDIQFAKTAKLINMKQLKTQSMKLIRMEQANTENVQLEKPPGDNQYDESYKPGFATFSSVYQNLSQHLTPTMAANLSPSVAFYGILHLCNENRLRLTKDETAGNESSFKIQEIE